MVTLAAAKTDKQRLLASLGKRQDELIALCARMVQIPSENPPGDTTEIAEFVERYLTSRGIPVRRYAPKAERPNLIASLDGGLPGRRLILNSHLDEYPVTGNDWRHPPFSGKIADGRIFGRGAADMRAGLASSLFIFGLIHDLRLTLQGQLVISFSSDEEAGGTWGTRWLLDNVPEIRGDGCLIGDQCGTWAVGAAEKGGCWLRLRFSGRSSHAAYGTAASAVSPMLAALSRIRELEGTRVPPPREMRPWLDRQATVVADEWGGQAADILDRVTVNIGRISGGSSINLVAESCEAELDIRLPLGISTSQIIEAVRAAVGSAAAVEVITAFEPSLTSPDDPLARAVIDNSRQVRGEAAMPVLRLGASDARWFRAAQIPTVVYGPKAYNMGGANEEVSIEDLLITTQVHAGCILDYLAGAR